MSNIRVEYSLVDKKPQPVAERQERPTSLCQVLRWSLVVLLVGLAHANLGAISPTSVAAQEHILSRSTDCGKLGNDCGAQAAKYSGLASSVQSTAGLLVSAPYGMAADRFGRKPLLLLSLLAMTWQYPFLAGTPSTLTPYYVALVAAGLLPFSQQVIATIISDLSPVGTRLERFGYATAGTSLSWGIGGLVGSLLVSRFGMHGMLKSSIVLTCFVPLALLVLLPETLSPKKQEAPKPKRNPYGRSFSIHKVLLPSKSADNVAKWQRSFYWLNIISALPEAGFLSISSFYITSRYGWGPVRLGLVGTVFTVGGFFWQTAGLRLLKMICPNTGRIFQLATFINLVHFLPYIFCTGNWAPFAAAALAGSGMVASLVLRAMVADLSDADYQGTAMGIIYACTQVCAVIAPGLFGTTFAFCTKHGVPQLPFALVAFGLLPFSIGLASYTLLPDCIPPTLCTNAAKAKQANEPLLSGFEGSQI